MPADRDPSRDGGADRGLAYGTEVAVSLCGYFLVYLIAHLLFRRMAYASPWLHWLPPARQAEYLAQAAGNDLLGHVALLSVPLLLIGSVLCYLRERDPLRGLGLAGSTGCLPLSFVAVFAGVFGYLTLLLGVIELGGGDLAQQLLALAVGFRRHLQPWIDLGWLSALVLPAAVFSYGMARTLLPFGHLLPLLRERFQPGVAGLLAIGLFVLPYAFAPAMTPLALLNVVLLGLILERLRVRTQGLWPPLLAFCGWVLCAELGPLPHQGMLANGPTPFDTFAPLLSGGSYGPEGGVVATLLFSAILVPLIGRGKRAAEPDTADPEPDAEPAA